jgi:hypothetical protein
LARLCDSEAEGKKTASVCTAAVGWLLPEAGWGLRTKNHGSVYQSRRQLAERSFTRLFIWVV